MADYPARAERAALCTLLVELGPERPTLCDGWSTRDLAAHLVLRERRPLATPGIALRPLAGYTARVQRSLARRPFATLVDTLRRPPRWSPAAIPVVDHAMNTMEMFIHHEDVRRAQPDWQPRPLSPALARLLWARVRGLARLRLRRFPATVTVEAPGHGSVRTGTGTGTSEGEGEGDAVQLRGDPGELLLFLAGRQAATRVELSGPEPLTGRLRHANLGL